MGGRDEPRDSDGEAERDERGDDDGEALALALPEGDGLARALTMGPLGVFAADVVMAGDEDARAERRGTPTSAARCATAAAAGALTGAAGLLPLLEACEREE